MWSKQTVRSALNQNRREQLPVSKLIPYLGLHEKKQQHLEGVQPNELCQKKKNRFPPTKKGTRRKQQHLRFQSLKRKRLDVCVCVGMFREAKEAKM